MIGFRQWRLHEGRLYSLRTPDPWDDGRLDAGCRKAGRAPGEPHLAPDPSCSCGVHAYYRPVPRTAATGWAGVVNGAVVLWGSVEAHDKGMRASHGQVVALVRPALPGSKRRAVEQIAAALGVELVAYRRLAAAAMHYGAPMPEAFKPPRSAVGVVSTFE